MCLVRTRRWERVEARRIDFKITILRLAFFFQLESLISEFLRILISIYGMRGFMRSYPFSISGAHCPSWIFRSFAIKSNGSNVVTHRGTSTRNVLHSVGVFSRLSRGLFSSFSFSLLFPSPPTLVDRSSVYCSYLVLSSFSPCWFETGIASRCVIEARYIININWLGVRACARINEAACLRACSVRARSRQR